jgi:hypothetical protein
MALAALAGLGTGALHAVAGPDHVLSLAPLSLGAGRRAWRIGLRWGAGHALGTAIVFAALSLAARSLAPFLTADAGERIAGVALLVTGALSLRRRPSASHGHVATGPALGVGLVHGVAGGAGVLLLFPAVASGGPAALGYLLGFTIGSTIAMAALTAALSAASRRPGALGGLAARASRFASGGSIALGAVWAMG